MDEMNIRPDKSSWAVGGGVLVGLGVGLVLAALISRIGRS